MTIPPRAPGAKADVRPPHHAKVAEIFGRLAPAPAPEPGDVVHRVSIVTKVGVVLAVALVDVLGDGEVFVFQGVDVGAPDESPFSWALLHRSAMGDERNAPSEWFLTDLVSLQESQTKTMHVRPVVAFHLESRRAPMESGPGRWTRGGAA
jgi:hypothetical protein